MNKSLINNLEVMIAEGHSSALGKLYNNLKEYKVLCNKVFETEKEISTFVNEDKVEIVKQYIRAHNNKNHFEQRFMYIQGMKDYSDILMALDDELLDKYLLDYDFKYDNEE